jgi:hypothetical protein
MDKEKSVVSGDIKHIINGIKHYLIRTYGEQIMKQIRIFGFAASFMLFLLLSMAGCTRPVEKPAAAKINSEKQIPAVKMALKFKVGDSATYRVISENDKSVEWEGSHPSKPKEFTGGHTGNKTETTFTQQIQSIDDKGNAVVKITIKQLKYVTTIKNNVVTDFDSSSGKDKDNPLNKLIGQSYTIEMTPSGKVSRIIDANEALATVGSASADDKIAAGLLSLKAITQRHTIPTLPDADKNQLRTGDKWSSIEDFSFDMMGAKSYEKIYTLKEIKNVDNRRIAIAQMEAVPSAENAKKLQEEQPASFFANFADNKETYTGELKLDLTNGKIEECHENLTTEWTIVDPNPKEGEQPAAMKMAAVRSFSIEKID